MLRIARPVVAAGATVLVVASLAAQAAFATEVPASIRVGSAPDPAPVSADDMYSTVQDTLLSVSAPGFISNDTDNGSPAEGQRLTLVSVTPTRHGVLDAHDDGSFTYQPDSGFVGSDTFTYALFDGGQDGNTATVTITVDELRGPSAAPPPVTPSDPETPADPSDPTTQLPTLGYTGSNAFVIILFEIGIRRRTLTASSPI